MDRKGISGSEKEVKGTKSNSWKQKDSWERSLDDRLTCGIKFVA